MMLLLRSGDSAMISDAAARPIAIIAVVTGSIAAIAVKYAQNYSRDFVLTLSIFFRDHQAFLYDPNAML